MVVEEPRHACFSVLFVCLLLILHGLAILLSFDNSVLQNKTSSHRVWVLRLHDVISLGLCQRRNCCLLMTGCFAANVGEAREEDGDHLLGFDSFILV